MVVYYLAAANAAETLQLCPRSGKADNELQLPLEQMELEVRV
jgi:hypothetical protein